MWKFHYILILLYARISSTLIDTCFNRRRESFPSGSLINLNDSWNYLKIVSSFLVIGNMRLIHMVETHRDLKWVNLNLIKLIINFLTSASK